MRVGIKGKKEQKEDEERQQRTRKRRSREEKCSAEVSCRVVGGKAEGGRTGGSVE